MKSYTVKITDEKIAKKLKHLTDNLKVWHSIHELVDNEIHQIGLTEKALNGMDNIRKSILDDVNREISNTSNEIANILKEQFLKDNQIKK